MTNIITTTGNGSFLVDFESYDESKTYKIVIARYDNDTESITDERYYYPLTNRFTTVPCVFGPASYAVIVLEKQDDGSYFGVFYEKFNLDVEEAGTEVVPLYTEQETEYVRWTNSAFIEAAKSMTKDCKDSLEKIDECTKHVRSMVYDFIKMVKNGRVKNIPVPNLNECLTMKKGICWDMAPLLCGLLRANGFPAKLVVGTLNDGMFATAHCWVQVYYNNKWNSIEAVKKNMGKKLSAYHAEYFY